MTPEEFKKWLEERLEHALYHKRNSNGLAFEMYQSAANVLQDVIKKYKEVLPHQQHLTKP